jgi:phenylpropionate dioxygenase-like ring-hydroxylating dioxygenase large terminal subunit
MYINFWYPMATAEELTADKPLKVRALGRDLVVFRDEAGKAACLSNTCTHRGGSLADGKIKGDCIECPYHGWQFDASGNVQRLPSLGKDANIPGRTRTDAYPVEERYGLIFAFLGDLPEAERPPIINIKEWDQEGWRGTLQHYGFKANYERSIENGIDPAHNEFVHDTHGMEGEDEEYKVNDMRLDNNGSDYGQGFWHTFKAPPLPEGQMRELREKAGDLEAGTGYHGPNQVWTYIHPSPEFWLHQYLIERPIDENNSYVYLICMRNCVLEEKNDDYVISRNQYVANQDVKVLENLHPVITPETNTKEFMTPSDKCILIYREHLKEWDEQGWRIDSRAIEANEGRVAYAIPSPERRNVKGWVLDAVPTVKGGRGAEDKLKAAS